MAHDAPAACPGKTVIRNIGLLLSGAIENPILDADTIVAVDGRITAVGRLKDVDVIGRDHGRRREGRRSSRRASSTAMSIPSPATGRHARTSLAGSIPPCTAASPR